MDEVSTWRDTFDDRQKKEIELAVIYARDFHHGTTGHNALMVIAQMADLLDKAEAIMNGDPVIKPLPPGVHVGR